MMCCTKCTWFPLIPLLVTIFAEKQKIIQTTDFFSKSQGILSRANMGYHKVTSQLSINKKRAKN